MKRTWASLKNRWEEDPLGTIYIGLGSFMMVYGLYRDLEYRHQHAQMQRRFNNQALSLFSPERNT